MYRGCPEIKIAPNKREVLITEGLSYQGFELARVKLQYMYDGNTEEIKFGLSHSKVSVHEGSSYQDFSVVQLPRHSSMNYYCFIK